MFGAQQTPNQFNFSGAPSSGTSSLFGGGAGTTTNTTFGGGGFGTSQATTGGLGVGAGLGATSTFNAGSLLGQPQASQSQAGASGFGSGASGGFGGFGASTATGLQQPQQQQSLFGQGQGQTSLFGQGQNTGTTGAGGLFGPPASTSTSLFGGGAGAGVGQTQPQLQSQSQTGFGMNTLGGVGMGMGAGGMQGQQVGQLQAQAQAGQLGLGLANFGTQSVESGISAFNDVFMAYNPTSPYCRFRSVFYNAVEPGTAPYIARPAGVDARLWEQAVLLNPDPEHLVPVQATGFEDLLTRLQVQKERVEVHKKTLSALDDELKKLSNHVQLETRVKYEEYRQKQAELAHRMLRMMRKLEVLQNRGIPFSADEGNLRARLEHIQAELHKPNQFKSHLAELASLVQVHGGSRSTSATASSSTSSGNFNFNDSEQQRAIFGHLDGMLTALDALRETLRKDARDIVLIERMRAKDDRSRNDSRVSRR